MANKKRRTVPRPVPEDLGSDIENRDEALQPDLTEAERSRKTSGEARAAHAFLERAVRPRVEACSERGVLASLGLGLLVRGLFTIRVADPLGLHDQPVYTDIPVSQAAIPDLSCRNLYLQLCRGPPGIGANTQPNAAVAAVLAAHPDLRARLAASPRHPSDTNMVDHVGKQLETAFSNMLTLLFAGRLKKSVSLAGAKVLVGTEEHRRRFGFWGVGGGYLPAWSKRECTYVRRMVCGLDVTWLLEQGGVVPTPAMQAEVALQRGLLGLEEGELVDHAWVEDSANRGRLLRHAVHTTREMEAAMAAWQLDMVPWQQAELTNPGLLPRPPRPPTPYALTPTSKFQARHVFIDTRGLYGMMHDAGMLGVMTEEGVTSLKKFRNACSFTRRAAADGQGLGRSQPVVSVRHWKLTAGQYYRDSGITRQTQATKTWLTQVKPQLTALSRVSSKPSSLASYRQFADTVLATYDAMWAEVSKQRWANAKFRLCSSKMRVVASFWAKVKKQAQKRWPDRILALAYGAASFSGSGSVGCRGVPVSQMRKEAVKQFGAGRVVLVEEFRTSRVSSAYSSPSEALPGQPPESFRWLRPVYSKAKRSQVRGLMSSTSHNIRFYDRDVSAALNIRRCAVGPGPRPTELCYWDGRPAMPKRGRPGQEWVYLPDKALLRKWRHKPADAAQPIMHRTFTAPQVAWRRPASFSARRLLLDPPASPAAKHTHVHGSAAYSPVAKAVANQSTPAQAKDYRQVAASILLEDEEEGRYQVPSSDSQGSGANSLTVERAVPGRVRQVAVLQLLRIEEGAFAGLVSGWATELSLSEEWEEEEQPADQQQGGKAAKQAGRQRRGKGQGRGQDKTGSSGFSGSLRQGHVRCVARVLCQVGTHAPERLPHTKAKECLDLCGCREQRTLIQLVSGVTRWRRRLDWLLAALSRRSVASLEPGMRQVLRLGLYELTEMHLAPHAISEFVDIARKVEGHEGAARLANGILRGAVRLMEAGRLPDPEAELQGKLQGRELARCLATVHSHPPWMVTRWLQRFGRDASEDLMRRNNMPPRYTVRANGLRGITASTLQGLLWLEGVEVQASILVPSHFLEVTSGLQLLLSQGHVAQGRCVVQDTAAGLVVLGALDPQPGDRVLDCCAAPGGKTLFAAALMKGEGHITALDVSQTRINALGAAAQRAGLPQPLLTTVATSLQDFARAACAHLSPAPANAAPAAPSPSLPPSTQPAKEADDSSTVEAGSSPGTGGGDSSSGGRRSGERGAAAGAGPKRMLDRALLPAQLYDRVLVDSPCSGSGVLAKRADLRWRRDLDDLQEMLGLQAELLDAASALVRPGGVLVYSTCSIEDDENEQQSTSFLQRHPEFELEPITADELQRRGVSPSVLTKTGCIATLPHVHDVDGAFAVRMRRKVAAYGALILASESMPAQASADTPQLLTIDWSSDGHGRYMHRASKVKEGASGSASISIYAHDFTGAERPSGSDVACQGRPCRLPSMRYSVEMTGAARERLEVPTTTSLERKLDVTSPRFPSDKPQIGPISRSSVLDQVRKFIPSLQAANKALERELEPGCQVRPASDLDIEHVDDDGAHIEMDLACGVFDLKDEQAVAAAEQAMARAKTEVAQSSSSCSSSSSDNSSCNTDGDGDDARGMGSASERAGGSQEGTSGSVRRRDGRQSRRKGAKQKAAKITVVGDADN
ncbi:hypothetical protein QJQ45_028131 [Haematococcus lacustris]|nr:hypothetical protein QJQ45_028131 [Haematococcus lacustris]